MLDDADLADTVEQFFASTFLNNGQICWLSTRVLAPRKRYQQVLETVAGLTGSLTVGDPLAEGTQSGPHGLVAAP